jgi:hypothetical protein
MLFCVYQAWYQTQTPGTVVAPPLRPRVFSSETTDVEAQFLNKKEKQGPHVYENPPSGRWRPQQNVYSRGEVILPLTVPQKID